MKKAIWLLVSCVMVAALLLASCAPAAPTEEKPTTPTEEKPTTPTEEKPTTPTEEKPTEEKPSVLPEEKPQYGGIFVMALGADIPLFDETLGHTVNSPTQMLTNDTVLTGDWAKGPAGSNEYTWFYYGTPPATVLTGGIAESWEMPDENTFIYHIRKGVRFHNKPPTNGREMNAEDVLFSIQRAWASPASIYPVGANFIESVTAPDKWTIVIKTKPGTAGVVYRYVSFYLKTVPREAVEMYGNLKDWRNAVGTGPFMLEDYVSGTAATFVKNPNYWMTDPVGKGKGSRLPYLDGVKWLVIPDPSTRMAALRTGRIDALHWVEVEDAMLLMKTNPDLEYVGNPSGAPMAVHMRIDNPALPWTKLDVRRALHMAVDLKEIANTYYSGQAEVLNYPAMAIPDCADYYTPLEELPESTRELFTYNPDKAKQLLAEAGYPDGFKAVVVCYKDQVDMLSIIKAYWEIIGVDLSLDVKEYSVYTSLGISKKHEEMYMHTADSATPEQFSRVRAGNIDNYGLINDPKIEAAYKTVASNFFDETLKRQTYKEIHPYILSQAYLIVMPSPYIYNLWQPWVKNYHGERYMPTWASTEFYLTYIWLDQDLKEEMTGKR